MTIIIIRQITGKSTLEVIAGVIEMALSVGKRNSFTDLLKDGYKHLQGIDETTFQNIQACKDISFMTRTSMGPNGRNKIIVNHLKKMFLTNDTTTILGEIEVAHPAVKILIPAVKQQHAEFGDGTGFVLAFAGELLNQAEDLLRMGLKPADLVSGYEEALKFTLDVLPTLQCDSISDWNNEKELEKLLLATISTKQYGLESVLVPLVVKACIVGLSSGKNSFSPECVRVVKILGGSVADSVLMNGIVLEREPDTKNVCYINNGKVAVFSCPIDIVASETKGTVLIHNSQEMRAFSKDEETSCERAMHELYNADFRILVTNGSVGEMMLHFANKLGIAILRVNTKFDLKRLCRAVGATAVQQFGFVDEKNAGHCDKLEIVEIGGSRCTLLHASKGRAVSLVLRGSTTNKLDDVERTIDACLEVVKSAISNSDASVPLLPGAGAVEMTLAVLLENYAKGVTGVQQYVIEKFSQAFQVIPRTLAENSGHNLIITMGNLAAAHATQSDKQIVCCEGIDIDESSSGSCLLNAKEHGIFDLLHTKRSGIHLAADAAISILRIDQIIMSRMAGGPKVRTGKQDEDD